jgi:hypothetical protein
MNKQFKLQTKPPPDEIAELAVYLQGMADATHNEKLSDAADWLKKLSEEICAQGYIGCEGGRKCTSDHK